jgi:hypothetical protein
MFISLKKLNIILKGREKERERERAERHKRKREHNKPTKCVKGSARGILRKS